jgi:hypothetical protein
MSEDFEAVVIGSGFGASADAKQIVCLLERRRKRPHILKRNAPASPVC